MHKLTSMGAMLCDVVVVVVLRTHLRAIYRWRRWPYENEWTGSIAMGLCMAAFGRQCSANKRPLPKKSLVSNKRPPLGVKFILDAPSNKCPLSYRCSPPRIALICEEMFHRGKSCNLVSSCLLCWQWITKCSLSGCFIIKEAMIDMIDTTWLSQMVMRTFIAEHGRPQSPYL